MTGLSMLQHYTYDELKALAPKYLREEFDAIEMGEKLPAFTDDVVFRKLLDPDIHRERVEKLFKLIFEVEDVHVISSGKTVHTKPSVLSKGTEQDVNVFLTQRGILNLEMQVKAQDFIVNRMNIYASDMNILQYSVAQGERKSDFNYCDIGHSYLIVFMKESPEVFKESPYFIHKKLEVTDTNIELKRLSTIVYVELNKCLKYVEEYGLLAGREELCKYLVLMADSNSEKSREFATEEEYRDILLDLQYMAKSREELFQMFSEKYAEAIKASEITSARREGKAEGKASEIQILRTMSKTFTVSQIAECVEFEENYISNILELIRKHPYESNLEIAKRILE